ncbi:MAG: FkbM family methyltransferase [Luteimonas sp.]
MPGSTILARIGRFRSRRFATASYSQEGEDLALKRMFGDIRAQPGFYIDVGCHHPFRFSNSYLFYLAGWSGICIDPLPGCAAKFRRWRPRDIFIDAAVSDAPGVRNYHMFDEAAVNTLDDENAARQAGRSRYSAKGVMQVRTDTLDALTRGLVSPETRVDFMSIDVEGLDLQVLRSNDWKRIRPRVVVAECLGTGIGELAGNPVNGFLTDLGYRASIVTGNSYLFKDMESVW